MVAKWWQNVAKCGKPTGGILEGNQRLGSSLSLCIGAFWAIALAIKSNMARQLFLGGFKHLQTGSIYFGR